VDRSRHQQVLQQFLQACAGGDASRLAAMLSERVVVFSDGGGKVPSALRPVSGADRASRFLTGIAKKGAAGARVELADVNGQPGAVLWSARCFWSTIRRNCRTLRPASWYVSYAFIPLADARR